MFGISCNVCNCLEQQLQHVYMSHVQCIVSQQEEAATAGYSFARDIPYHKYCGAVYVVGCIGVSGGWHVIAAPVAQRYDVGHVLYMCL